MPTYEGITAEQRIRYVHDEEANRPSTPKGNRQHSTSDQLSIHSLHSRRGSIDPGLAIPIQFRTVSSQLEESKESQSAHGEKSKATELGALEWHKLTLNELFNRLSTSQTHGLSAEQVQRRIPEYGRNVPSPPPSRLGQDIFGYFFRGFGSILLLGSILTFICWKPLGRPPAPANLALAIVLLIVFFIQAAFNAWQDWSSSKTMASITTMLPDHCLLVRDGNQTEILASEVVPGDVVCIKAGNKLPADVRLVEISSDAKFDRSILTGESVPVSGTVDSTNENYLETHCIGLQGTHCISGTGIGVVVATGDRTVFGRIAKLTSQPSTGSTTLEKEIFRFVMIIASLMLFMIILVVIIWASYLRIKYPSWISVPLLIVDFVSIAIAFMPVGLPVALTASVTIIANIMRKNKILCKSLKTVETLGAVSVICSDKTGTLTQNQMCVSEFSIGENRMTIASAHDEQAKSIGNTEFSSTNNRVNQFRAIAGLCNAGDFDPTSDHLPLEDRKINGDATDQAILRLSESLGSVAELRRTWKKKFDLAFNSKDKFMIRVLGLAEQEGLNVGLPAQDAQAFKRDLDLLLTIKGAPDVLIDRCTTITSDDGAIRIFDDRTRAVIEELKNDWSSQGKRVILLARKIVSQRDVRSLPSSSEFELEILKHARSGLTLVGLVGIVDPPRREIPEVVRTLRRAGIRLFMVTGDFRLTAQAIAQQCGIITNPPSLVHDITALTGDIPKETPEKANLIFPKAPQVAHTSIVLNGPELITLNESQWSQLCRYDEIVVARTTPEQKLRIVKELQALDNIVGMTGDGINDAPALKAADIGIALGSGSDIAIEAADMVLLDSFSAIIEAVQYGRVVYDNLKKTIMYLLPAGSFSEFWPIMANVAFGLPQVLSSFLMIVICCFTDCAAGTTLAYEKPEADVLLRAPRNPKKDKLVDWKLILQAYGFLGVAETVTSFAMSFWYAQRRGVPFSAFWFRYGSIPENLSQEYVNQVVNEMSSIFFINLVVMQWFNLMAVRTRRLSIFQQPPVFNKSTQNLYLFPAILFALAISCFFLYVKPLQNTVNTTSVPVEYFFLPMTFGLGMLFTDEARKWGVRRWPGGLLAQIAW